MQNFALNFTLAAAHFLWIGAGLALVICLLDRMFIRSAAARHGLYLLGMLAAAAAVPICIAIQHGGSETVAGVVAQARPEQTAAREKQPPLPWKGQSPVEFQDAATPAVEAVNGSGGVALSEARGSRLESAAPWVMRIYLGGLALMGLRLGVGWVSGVQTRRRGEPVTEASWRLAAQRAGQAVGLRVLPALKWSREVAAPVVAGFAKPVILLPLALASRLSPGQVEAVLAHEMAHLVRRDLWAVLVQRVVECLLFFHPAVWWMSREMERAREEACDAVVVAAGWDPADYAEALLTCSQFRLEQAEPIPQNGFSVAATGTNGVPLRRRVLRLLGQDQQGTERLGRTGWVMVALMIAGITIAVAAIGGRRPDLEGFYFNDPPASYEKGIHVANRNQSIELGSLKFQAGGLSRDDEGWLRLDLGVAEGYEIIEIRLFNHGTRKFFHSSKFKEADLSGFLAERIGSTSSIRIKENGSVFPDRIDVWMRVVTQGPGPAAVLPAADGASSSLGGSEIILSSLHAGSMTGQSDASGKMIWDLASAERKERTTTVGLENRGELLGGKHHAVAVKKDGTRHPMDGSHFIDFSLHGRHVATIFDVAKDDLDRFEIYEFGERHKFFFNGLEIPRAKLPELSQRQLKEVERQVAAFVQEQITLDEAVSKIAGFGAGVAPEMIRLMSSGWSDTLALRVLERFKGDLAVQDLLVRTLREAQQQPPHRIPNTVFCSLLALGGSGNPDHARLISEFLKTEWYPAAIYALQRLGGDEAREFLLSAFDIIPKDGWFIAVASLKDMGDPAAVPELQRRLKEVESSPAGSYPPRTHADLSNAIATLSSAQPVLARSPADGARMFERVQLFIHDHRFGPSTGCLCDLLSEGRMSCGQFPNQNSVVTWKWLRRTKAGDLYSFTRSYEGEAPEKAESKQVEYTGKQQVLWEDPVQRIILRPGQ